MASELKSSTTYLDFEQPIADLEKKIEELRFMTGGSELNLTEEISRLEARIKDQSKQIFANLTPWQIAQLARHPQRPYALDYIKAIFTEWEELHGDRHFADDPAIVSGVARLDGRAVAIIGEQKGRDTKERIYRNFGSPRPEGYRKALRVMKLAEKFNLPIVTLIDTAGAYAGISAEERNQSEAIARNLFELSRLRTPIVATVTGEGGSGGALAMACGNRVLMLEHSIYSVITPEGCASILLRDGTKAEGAAKAMKITAQDLIGFKIIDRIIPEPVGGAHTDPVATVRTVGDAIEEELHALLQFSASELKAQRAQRFLAIGRG